MGDVHLGREKLYLEGGGGGNPSVPPLCQTLTSLLHTNTQSYTCAHFYYGCKDTQSVLGVVHLHGQPLQDEPFTISCPSLVPTGRKRLNLIYSMWRLMLSLRFCGPRLAHALCCNQRRRSGDASEKKVR